MLGWRRFPALVCIERMEIKWFHVKAKLVNSGGVDMLKTSYNLNVVWIKADPRAKLFFDRTFILPLG